jgi:hypothetical protein
MSETTSRFKGLDPVDYINSLLVTKKVREAYLIQNFEPTTDSIDVKIRDILKGISSIKTIKT